MKIENEILLIDGYHRIYALAINNKKRRKTIYYKIKENK